MVSNLRFLTPLYRLAYTVFCLKEKQKKKSQMIPSNRDCSFSHLQRLLGQDPECRWCVQLPSKHLMERTNRNFDSVKLTTGKEEQTSKTLGQNILRLKTKSSADAALSPWSMSHLLTCICYVQYCSQTLGGGHILISLEEMQHALLCMSAAQTIFRFFFIKMANMCIHNFVI